MDVHIGIDIGGSFVKYGLIDRDGRILFSGRTPARGDDGTRVIVGIVVDCAAQMVDWAGANDHTAVSVGVGSPGTIDPETHCVQPPSPNIPAIIDVDFSKFIQDSTGLPTVIDNDANCAAWAEHRYGAARGVDDLVCLTVGSGLGSGFILGGKILSGPTGSAGELGHTTIDWNGPACPCGSRGCLENYVSATALLRLAAGAADADPAGVLAQHRDTSAGRMSIAGLFAAGREGDTAARRILAESAFQLALGILTAVNVCDPEAVIIGGGVADVDHDHGGAWLTAIRENVHRHAFSAAGKRLPVGRAALGNDAGFIGAAALGADALQIKTRCV